MTVYVIADVEVVDPAGYEDYRARVPATIAAHGGRYLARGGATEVLEGSWSPHRCIISNSPTWTGSAPGGRRPTTCRCARSASGPRGRTWSSPRGCREA